MRILPLMHELDRRARALGLSPGELARRIGVDGSTLRHIRTGRDRPSLGMLHGIASWAPDDLVMQRLVWEYLLVDVQTPKERRQRGATRSDAGRRHAPTLSESSLVALRAFVRMLPEAALRGAGVLLHGPDGAILSAAVGYLEGELRARGVAVQREAARARVAGSHRTALLAATVVLVEHVEFLSPHMREVLEARAAYRKVTVATSPQVDLDLPPRLTPLSMEA